MLEKSAQFPQAQLHEMATAHLPPLPEEAQRFLSQTISIALVGCSPEDCGIVLVVGVDLKCVRRL